MSHIPGFILEIDRVKYEKFMFILNTKKNKKADYVKNNLTYYNNHLKKIYEYTKHTKIIVK